MRNNDLSVMLIVAVLASFTGIAAYGQQTAPQSTPQQDVPVTPEGKPPPAEITPDHPLKAPTTNGAAQRIGPADPKPSKDDNKRDRERER